MANELLTIQRSEALYLVGDKNKAIIVDMDEGTTSPIMNAQSILAHLVVNTPWEVISKRDDLPAAVRAAIATMSH